MDKKIKIMIVEDEEDLIEVISFNLEAEGYEIVSTANGEDALDIIRNERPDLVLLDIMLPGQDGFTICGQIKSDIHLNQIPIIMVTAKNTEEDIVHGLELGADDYITKPFSIKVLTARIKTVLRRQENKQDKNILTIDTLVIDNNTFSVYIDSQPVKLTIAEFNALYIFANRPGRVFTRNQLIDAIRGEGHIVTNRTIDVLIVGLRKKLDKYANYIETVRGVGYRFINEKTSA